MKPPSSCVVLPGLASALAKARDTDAETRRPPPPDWGARREGVLPAETIHGRFERMAAERPEAVALMWDETEMSYRELNRRANCLGFFLREKGLAPDQPVAICTERSLELVVGQLGILKAGGAYVPLDAASPRERLGDMLDDTGAQVVLTQRHLLDRLPVSARGRAVCLDGDWPEIARRPHHNPSAAVAPENLAYIIYTSGSTGRPKGVAVPHRGVVRLVHGQDYAPFGPDQRHLLMASPAFDAIVFELWGALLHGGACVIYPDHWPDFARLERIIRERRVTCVWLTAGLFNQIIDHRPETLAFARHVLTGGEALSPRHVRRALKLLPHLALTNGYGPTECTTFACTHRIGAVEDGDGGRVPIGRPINHTECHIVDERMAPVPVGEPGELLIGGAGLARGYHRRPELTAEKFIPDPFGPDPAARLYRTGDRCRWRPDGRIEFLGRMDDQIKLRGFRIEPGEVEAALRRMPNVRNCAVCALQGPAGRQLAAALVAEEGRVAPAHELRARMAALLPDYMIPTRFRHVDALPLNANGKVDRAALAALFEAEAGAPDAAPAPVAARTAGADAVLVNRMLTLWRRVLGQPGLRADQGFFDHGGDSLLCLQLALEIERAFGRRVPMQAIYAHPSAEAFAAHWPDRENAADLFSLRGRGPGAPVFHVPGVGGVEKLSPSRIAVLEGRRRYYDELAHPGAGDDRRPLDRVEDLAAEMTRQIRRVFPAGPVVLTGFSFGGVLAFETARQLRAAGYPVEHVVLWDSMCDDLLERRGLWEIAREQGRRLAHKFWRTAARGRWGEFFRPEPSPTRRVLWLKLLDRVAPHALLGPRVRGLLPHRDKICLAALRAYHGYQPAAYDGDVLLFRCTSYNVGLFHRLRDVPGHGWGRFVRGRFTVRDLFCAHEEIMDEPVATVILEKTLRALEELRPGGAA